MKIITVNLNPAYDIYYRVPGFRQYKENLAESVSVFTGGKGMNVSRALKTNGIGSTAYLLLGRENSQAYTDGITADGIDARIFYAPGRIRENLTFLTDGIPETRVSVNSFSASPTDLGKILQALSEECLPDTVIVCSGKFPKGISAGCAMDFVRELKKISQRVVLDSNTFSAEQVVSLSPWLIKPNDEEIETLCGRPVSDTDDCLSAAEELFRGGISNVFVTLGENGAVYCGELGKCRASVPHIAPLSTIGAGDSTVAGFVAAYSSGRPLEDCVRTACAFGTAACLEVGTNPPKPERVAELYRQIKITIL